MASNAFSGVGSHFARENDLSSDPAVYIVLAEVNSIEGPTKSKDQIDVTSLDSTDGYREFIGGFRDGGEVSLVMNFTNAGYKTMNLDFESASTHQYRIELPNSPAGGGDGTLFTFWALVVNLGVSVPMDDKVTATITLKISGTVTMTDPTT